MFELETSTLNSEIKDLEFHSRSKKSNLNFANCFKITYLLGIISVYLGLHLKTEVIVVRGHPKTMLTKVGR